ncbi:MAG: recombinase, partial [Saprospiraceae bacterium]|nr:recombinase [Saprospiraceae bacterium]
EILNRYIKDKKQSDFILNVITSPDEIKQHVQAREELKRVNKRLKTIGSECGITQPLTSYVARHTYATIANEVI